VGKFPKEMNAQIAREYAASQQYVAIAVHYDQETLPQLAAHFYRQALEERNHAMMIVQYLLDAEEEVAIPGIEPPRTKFGDAVEPVALALAQEREVTDQIKALTVLARKEEELVGEEFLRWFLKEQLEETSSMADLLRVVERASESNVLLAEDYLSRQQIGDHGDDPMAPAAAGGAL
jgi:bacterioferritin B